MRQVQSSWQAKHHAPTHGQKQRHKRELREVRDGLRDVATAPVSDRLQSAIDRAAAENQTVGDFAVQLARAGITCKLKITRTGKVQGISYQMEGVNFQGNQLYDASLPKLQSVHSLDFDLQRDSVSVALAGQQKIETAAVFSPLVEAPEFVQQSLEQVRIPSQKGDNATSSKQVNRSRQQDRGR